MANVLLSDLPTYTGNTSGVWIPINDSGNTITYKVVKENLVASSSSGSSGTSGTSVDELQVSLISQVYG